MDEAATLWPHRRVPSLPSDRGLKGSVVFDRQLALSVHSDASNQSGFGAEIVNFKVARYGDIGPIGIHSMHSIAGVPVIIRVILKEMPSARKRLVIRLPVFATELTAHSTAFEQIVNLQVLKVQIVHSVDAHSDHSLRNVGHPVVIAAQIRMSEVGEGMEAECPSPEAIVLSECKSVGVKHAHFAPIGGGHSQSNVGVSHRVTDILHFGPIDVLPRFDLIA